jgi:hypothetical protein
VRQEASAAVRVFRSDVFASFSLLVLAKGFYQTGVQGSLTEGYVGLTWEAFLCTPGSSFQHLIGTATTEFHVHTELNIA